VKTRQFTVAFAEPVDVRELKRVLEAWYDIVEIGSGVTVNGIPNDYLVVHNERPKRMD
jgi:hypothetical protein